MKVQFYGYGILVLGLMSLLASCKAPTSSTSPPSSPGSPGSPGSPSKVWVVSTLAGSGTAGSADGNGAEAQFNYPRGVGVDSAGNVYVADTVSHRIRKITAEGVVTTLAGIGTGGSADGNVDTAQFNYPFGVAVGSASNVYVADTYNHRIRKITTNSSGVVVVSTLAGSGTAGSANGNDTAAQFNYPYGVAVDSAGNVYVTDSTSHLFRKLTADREVSTLAGTTGTRGYKDATGTAAQFNSPSGVAVDSNGIVYVGDSKNHRIRKITINSSGVGVVTTLAGSGEAAFLDGSDTAAKFNEPNGVAVDSDDNVYVADSANHRIRKITEEGVVSTLAGSGVGFADGNSTAAQFRSPFGVAVDSNGIVYVADTDNHRIRKIEYRVP